MRVSRARVRSFMPIGVGTARGTEERPSGPASVSLSAGSFVCNDVFFTLAHVSVNTPGLRAGFIHVPWDAENAPPGAASLPQADITRALEIAVITTLTYTRDLDVPAGHLA